MLELFNTMTRRKELFKPLWDKEVKMFTCGPSIYRRPHLGNYRSFLWEDALQRYLEYLGFEVQRVINFTDIEDKAMSEARKEGIAVNDLTEQVSEQFFKDTRFLRVKLPSFIPRSSTSVPQAVKLIKILLEKGYAYYWDKGDVFFDPLKFKGFGKLYRLDMSRWPKEKRRFHRDTYPGRRWNRGDFILWHGYREGDEVFWDTEIGKGRPSWNIQDPAMITEHLGYQIDISCGGIDNLYRHHDYNLAVIEAVSGKEFARYWVHGEHLLVDGKKMSKSKGNILYPEDLHKEGYSAEEIRFFLLYSQHRKRMNLTRRNLEAARSKLKAFREALGLLLDTPSPDEELSHGAVPDLVDSLPQLFEQHMDNDLDIKGAFDALSGAVSKLADYSAKHRVGKSDRSRVGEALKGIDEVFQFVFPLKPRGGMSD